MFTRKDFSEKVIYGNKFYVLWLIFLQSVNFFTLLLNMLLDEMFFVLHIVNITGIKLKASQDISSFRVSDLCQSKDEEQVQGNFFELPEVVKDVLSPLHIVQESTIFQRLWAQYGRKAQTARKNDATQTRELSVSSMKVYVWEPAYLAWNQLAVFAFDGSLTLTDVDKLFESYKNRKEELLQEVLRIFKLSQVSDDASDLQVKAEERVTQIQRYQQLEQYASAADTIWEFKEQMGFTGDFKVIKDLSNQVSIIR